MVIDTSALIAILKGEHGHERLLEAVVDTQVRLLSSVTLLETTIVWFRQTRSTEAVLALYQLINDLQITVVAFDENAARTATTCYMRYGKGVQSPGLNFGDCAVWALAIENNAPILCTTDEFLLAGVPSPKLG